MRYGAMDYLLPAADEVAQLRMARELGLSGVEVGLTRAALQEPGAPRLARLLAAARETGVAIPSLCLGEHNNGGLGSADPQVASAARADVLQAIAWAADLGAPVILVPFFFGGDIADPASFARAADAFRDLCPVAERRGVALCYEGTLPAARIQDLARAVGSPAFGCYFDLANVVWLGMDTPTEIRGLGGLIRQVHMKESLVGPGDVRPGQGRVNYPGSAAALREVGYNGWVVLETPGGTPEEVAGDLAFTKRLFEQA
jgi:sugar phosphate isomerase/epimerase